MATASEIAAACRQLASQVQTVHHPNVQNSQVQIGHFLGQLVSDGEQVLIGNFNPLLDEFNALSGHFAAILSWLENHPARLNNLATQLETIASDVL
ncbi:MAG: hypothetical protein M0Z95_12005 [Actinomycetota bacterium]|jgi:hypothetical protein|nr:hypothetical protein [Actinomycetota bacterium]